MLKFEIEKPCFIPGVGPCKVGDVVKVPDAFAMPVGKSYGKLVEDNKESPKAEEPKAEEPRKRGKSKQ